MSNNIRAILAVGCLFLTAPLSAEIPCNVVVNTPEDELMLAVNGADNPQDQITALDKFAQAHGDSKFMPCANAAYTTAYLKLNNFDKAIEYGEKNVAANTLDMTLTVNLLKAYVASGKPSDTAFDLIGKFPALLKEEQNPPRPPKVSDADWQKTQQEIAEQAKDERAFAEYAFFQLLPRLTDSPKRIQTLDAFMAAYPDTQNAQQVNFQYFMAYEMANNPAKADEYGEKAIAQDPNNIEYLNAVANDYASRQVSLDKAATYAKKVVDLTPAMKKPEGSSDAQFKTFQNNQLGLAHLTLGTVASLKAGTTKKMGPAIQEFKTAADLLGGYPELEGKALYYLGYAYEAGTPVRHHEAIEALTKASSVTSPWKPQAQDLLAKVQKAAGRK